jgi:hypothetical protein
MGTQSTIASHSGRRKLFEARLAAMAEGRNERGAMHVPPQIPAEDSSSAGIPAFSVNAGRTA